MSFTNIFGGSPINPAFLSYAAYTINSTIQLVWPDTNPAEYVMAQILPITATMTSLQVQLPDATLGSTGYAFYVQNTGSIAFTVTDYLGNTVQAVAPGQVFIIWLTSNTVSTGPWFSGQVTASVVQANAAALAGAGLKAISASLNLNLAANDQSGNYAMTAGDRGTVINNQGGTVVYTMPSPGTSGSGWVVAVKNSGTGTLTVNPNSTETIDNTTSITLLSEESTFLITDGVNWYTVGRGRQLSFNISQLNIAVSPTSGTMTLTSTQTANQMIVFTGTLTGNLTVTVPAAVQVYYITNNTTGSYTLTLSTPSGSGVVVPQAGGRLILACDGVNVYNPDSSLSASAVTSITAGTGLSASPSNPITTTGTLSITNSGVSPGTYAGFTINAQGQVTSVAAGGFRTILSGNTTYYVSPTGNDANNGSSGSPFLTVQHAINVIANTLDLDGYTVTISVADGLYTGAIVANQPFLNGTVQLIGDTTTPTNVIFNVTNSTAIYVGPNVSLTLGGGYLIETTTSGYGLLVNNGNVTISGPITWGACASAHIYATNLAVISYSGQTEKITGAAISHIFADGASDVTYGSNTVTITSTPTFTQFVSVTNNAVLSCASNTFSGAATGSYFNVANGGVVQTGTSGNLSYFPGSTAGTLGIGGQYDGIISSPGGITRSTLKGNWVSTTTATWTANQITLNNSNYQTFLLTNYSQTLNSAAFGAGGLDTGSAAASTWYHVHAIYGISGTSILFSLSATAPTLPSGYTYFAKIGTIYLDSSKNIRGFTQFYRKTQWGLGSNLSALPILATGPAGNISTPTYVAVAVSPGAPPTAAAIKIFGTNLSGGNIMIAPNNNYGAIDSAIVPPYSTLAQSGTGNPAVFVIELILESTNVYWATNTTNNLNVLGYEDNL